MAAIVVRFYIFYDQIRTDSLDRNSSYSNLEYFVSEGQEFSILFISCTWVRSLQSTRNFYGQMMTVSLSRNSSHSNFENLVSDDQKFSKIPVFYFVHIL